MKRYALIVGLVLCVIATSFAAGSEEAEGGAERATLTFWDMVWGPPEYVETARALVDEFNASHDNIEVEYVSKAWTNWYESLVTAVTTGTNPDVATTAAFFPWQLSELGGTQALPLDDVVQAWDEEGLEFVPGTLESMKWDGQYIAAPFGIDMRVLYVRKDLMEENGLTEYPSTWSELRQFAQELTTDDYYGMGIPGDLMGWQTMYSFIANNGGGFFTEEGGDPASNMLSDRVVEAAEFISQMVADGSVDPAGAGLDKTDMTRLFGQGRVAMTFQSSGWENNFPEQLDDIAVMPMFESPHGTKGTFGATNPIIVYDNTEYPEAAKTFLKWWVENNLELWTEGHQTQVPTVVEFQKAEYFQEDRFAQVVAEEWAPYVQDISANYPSRFPELNEIEGEGVLFTMIQDLIQGKEARPVLEQVDERFQEILSE